MNASRICDYLQHAREKEPDMHLRDDLNIAWLTVLWAGNGIPERIIFPGPANVAATYQVLHCHPDDVWPMILADRRSRLGEEFSDWYDQAGNLKPDVPGKKPAPVYEPNPQIEQAINERLAAVIAWPKRA